MYLRIQEFYSLTVKCKLQPSTDTVTNEELFYYVFTMTTNLCH